MKKMAFVLGLAVIVLSNAILLIRVARNRSGGAAQTIEMTDRELPLMPREPEDTSASLRLDWRRYSAGINGVRAPREANVVFEQEELRSLGFRLGTPDEKDPKFRVPQRRLLYVALEYSASDEATAISTATAERKPWRSRLRAVDAGESFEILQEKYPDKRRHLIVRGLVDAWAVNDPARHDPPRWEGYVTMVIPSEIQVPLPFSKVLASEPHYVVTLHYGRNCEPWIGALSVSETKRDD